jgi:3-dehydroquinate synthase
MSLTGFTVKSRIKDYSVNFLDQSLLPDSLLELPNSIFAVDENVWRFYKDGFLRPLENKIVKQVEISEEKKSLAGVGSLYDSIIELAPKKNTLIIAIGGGILQDIAGFTASTLYRGINWVFLPTTMLAQCDSCIGAKTSLNYKGFKNLIGTFYPPLAVYIYSGFMKTQQEVDYLSGVGELVKLHLIGGEKLTGELYQKIEKLLKRDERTMLELVNASLLIKKSFIEEDEFDYGRRNLLNFGHCFGHAIESASNYIISHGQAVTIGIVLANRVSVARGLMTPEKERWLNEKLLLPIIKLKQAYNNLQVEPIIDAMKKDKKRTGAGLTLVLMGEKHEMYRVSDLYEDEVRKAIKTGITSP